jgi:DNA polymerase III delta prime subunit
MTDPVPSVGHAAPGRRVMTPGVTPAAVTADGSERKEIAAGLKRGGVVMLAGPDGVGKTTLAQELAQGLFGDVPLRRVHHARGMGVLPRRRHAAGSSSKPHGSSVYPRFLTMVKLVYLFVDFRVGWAVRVRPFVRRGGWVLLQRHWWDIVVDPTRYRLYPSPRLGAFLGRLLPRPDIVLVLEAPAGMIAERKNELPQPELARQMRVWRTLLPAGQRRAYLDAALPVREVVRLAGEEICSLRDEASPGWVNLPTRDDARWIVPRGPRAAAVAGLSVYQPVTWKGRLGWRAARLVARLGLFRLLPAGVGPAAEVRDVLTTHVPLRGTLAVARANHPGRFVVLLLEREGTCTAVAKVATDPRGRQLLEDEADRLAAFGSLLPHPLSPPKLLGRESGVLLFEPVRWRPRRRPWRLPPEAAFALGGFFRGRRVETHPTSGFVHRDVAPWNLLRTREGWVLIDWEEAEANGSPFHDVAHHLVQSAALIGRPSHRKILSGLEGKGWVGESIRAYAAGAGLPMEEVTGCFVAYLQSSMQAQDPATVDGRRGIRTRRALLHALKLRERSS